MCPERLQDGSSRRRLMALAAVVLLFVVGRLLVVTSTGHLLFHLDSAEYGILRGIRLYLDGSTLDVLLDANTRLRFGLSTTLVADTGLHGTLVLAGLLLHFVVTTFDAPIATHTLRVLAVCVSTTALVVWLRVLWRAFPKSSVPVYYALLVLAAPPMLWKLSVLFWGTHELVLFLHALMLLAFAGWVGKPSETVQSAVLRSLALGAVGAVAMAANTSLALPAAMLGLWVAGEAVWHARERVGRAALLGGVFAVLGPARSSSHDHPPELAAAVQDTMLDLAVGGAAVQVRVDPLAKPRDIVGVHLAEPGVHALSERLIIGEPEHLPPARREEHVAREQVPVPHAVAGAFGREHVPLPRPKKLSRRGLALRDVHTVQVD